MSALYKLECFLEEEEGEEEGLYLKSLILADLSSERC